MSKNINLKLFKTVTAVFFVFATLFVGNGAWGQNPNNNAIIGYRALVQIPGTNLYQPFTLMSAPCEYYDAGKPLTSGSWDGYTTKKVNPGKPLSHFRGQQFSFPKVPITHNYQIHAVQVTAADVDRWWENAVFKPSDGYTRITGASLNQNCHGYSMGLGYWMNSFNTKVGDDYIPCNSVFPDGFPSRAIYGKSDGYTDHSILIHEVTQLTQFAWEVVKTREKYAESGVYEKAGTQNNVFDVFEDVRLPLNIANSQGNSSIVFVDGFYKPKP